MNLFKVIFSVILLGLISIFIGLILKLLIQQIVIVSMFYSHTFL